MKKVITKLELKNELIICSVYLPLATVVKIRRFCNDHKISISQFIRDSLYSIPKSKELPNISYSGDRNYHKKVSVNLPLWQYKLIQKMSSRKLTRILEYYLKK